MDLQVGSQIAESRKFHAYHWLMHFYDSRLLAINLCRLALAGQTVKTCIYLHPNLSSTKVNASPRKSSQVGGSMRFYGLFYSSHYQCHIGNFKY